VLISVSGAAKHTSPASWAVSNHTEQRVYDFVRNSSSRSLEIMASSSAISGLRARSGSSSMI
jgi:hypothetical protein